MCAEISEESAAYMEAVISSEMSIHTYQNTRRHTTQSCNLHSHRR